MNGHKLHTRNIHPLTLMLLLRASRQIPTTSDVPSRLQDAARGWREAGEPDLATFRYENDGQQHQRWMAEPTALLLNEASSVKMNPAESLFAHALCCWQLGGCPDLSYPTTGTMFLSDST